VCWLAKPGSYGHEFKSYSVHTALITNSRLHSNLLPYSHTAATFPHGMLLNIPRKKTGILEDVFSCGWMDAMKSSSAPPENITMDVNHGLASSETDPYSNWLISILLYFN